ncbi:MAG: hypothetical protein KDA81_22170, partial [Planctomycetaceae bacterium]|nr:hypothetical protein [Planctomycetaceae bacterium]
MNRSHECVDAVDREGQIACSDDEPPGSSLDQLLSLPVIPLTAPASAESGTGLLSPATSSTAVLLSPFEQQTLPTGVLSVPPKSGRKVTRRSLPPSPFEIASTERARAFRRRHFPDTRLADWNDWRWQSRNRIRTLAQFESFVQLSDDERNALSQGGTMLPVGITPYYMSLLDADNPAQPLRKTVIPTSSEFERTVGEADDPLGEDGHSPVPGLVHRYPDRVLLLPLDFCSTYCRYCTRSRVVGHGEIVPNPKRLEAVFDYLRATPQVRDVLISGGDALALSDDK